MWTYAFLFSSLIVAGDTLLPHRASVISSTRRTDTHARYDESFFYTALPTAVPLNDGGLKGDLFELGYLEDNVPRTDGKIAAVVVAAITLTLLIALVPGRLSQFLRLGLQQFVECLLYTAPNQFFDLTLDYFIVQLYTLFGYGLLSPFRMMCRNFILSEICQPCLLLSLFNL